MPRPKQVAKTAKAAARTAPRRADYGLPIDGFFAKQPPHLRAILEALRELIDEAAPDAQSSLKWGMPLYTIGGAMMCGLGGHKSHVNLILVGSPGAFIDPDRLLSGKGRGSRHLQLRTMEALPRAAVRKWLHAAARDARKQARP